MIDPPCRYNSGKSCKVAEEIKQSQVNQLTEGYKVHAMKVTGCASSKQKGIQIPLGKTGFKSPAF